MSPVVDANSADKAFGEARSERSPTAIGPGRSFNHAPLCDPGADAQYVTCGTVSLKLPRSGRVLLIMDGAWRTDTAPSSGRCRFFGPGTSNQQAEFGEDDDSNVLYSFGFNEVTGKLVAGRRTFGFECREFTGDTIAFKDVMMSAVFVGAR
ncbi:MAG: hypothetical protein ACRDK3_10535 [Actinomycetota bacterium]